MHGGYKDEPNMYLTPCRGPGINAQHQGGQMEIDRRHFITSLGGAAAVKLMSHEARAEALESYMSRRLQTPQAADKKPKFPTAAEMESQIATRSYRRGVGSAF